MRGFVLAAATLLLLSGSAAVPRAGSVELAMGPTSAPHKPGGNPNAAETSSSEAGSASGSAEMHRKKAKRRHGKPPRN